MRPGRGRPGQAVGPSWPGEELGFCSEVSGNTLVGFTSCVCFLFLRGSLGLCGRLGREAIGRLPLQETVVAQVRQAVGRGERWAGSTWSWSW